MIFFSSRHVLALVCGAVWAGGCGACEPDKSVSEHDAVAASAPPAASRILSPPVGLGPRSAALPCRAIAITGDVQQEAGDGGIPLAEHGETPRSGWLLLSGGARLVVKDPRTGRETMFRGPGRARACVDHGEESWLVTGTFESAAGTGETPGGEEWVVTPFGVVRFGAAKLTIEAGAKDVRVRVLSGPAFIWTADDASGHGPDGGTQRASETDEGWVRLTEGAGTLAPTSTLAPLASARSAVQACTTLAQAAHDLAEALLETDADPLTAMRQVATRRRARASCAVAGLRREALSASDGPSDLVAPLSATLQRAAALWRSLPLAR